MNCLCCGKPLKKETPLGWHAACVKRFFGTSTLPEIDIDENALELLAKETVKNGLTVPGVQKKLSLHIHSSGKNARLTLVNYPTGYILKPQVKEYQALPQSEQLVMTLADACGIGTVPHALIYLNGSYAYITKRIDRVFSRDSVKSIAMEDFCQLDLRLTQDKYKGSYERCANLISRYSSRKQLDLSELFMRLLFSYITGNSDMHLKNFSLIAVNNNEYVLSPAYDLLPVNTIMPEDNEQFALTLNGKKRNITKNDFRDFAKGCGIEKAAADKMILRMLSFKDKFVNITKDSLLPDELKNNLIELILNRCDNLK